MTTFPTEVLDELRWSKVFGTVEHDGTLYTLVDSPKTIDTTRWGIVDRMIFQVQDKLYEAVYEQGATEMQDHDDFDDNEEWDCAEVVAREVTVTEYVKA